MLTRATNLQPKYQREHCLVVSRQVGGCSKCEDICPHNAITIDRDVSIDDIDCTGCGLCVQECPSQALEASLAYQPGAPLKCSKVKGGAQTTQCLTRLQSSDLIRLAGQKGKVHLIRGDCENCSIGSPDVPFFVESLFEATELLAEEAQRPIELKLSQEEKYDSVDNPDKISRRDLIRGGFRSLQVSAADVVAPLENFADAGKDAKPLPLELERKRTLFAMTKPEPEQGFHWAKPIVEEDCLLCPVCTNVCPTDAFGRIFPKSGSGDSTKLTLDIGRCNGCNACVQSCPVDVIRLEETSTWQEITDGTQIVFQRLQTGNSYGVARNSNENGN